MSKAACACIVITSAPALVVLWSGNMLEPAFSPMAATLTLPLSCRCCHTPCTAAATLTLTPSCRCRRAARSPIAVATLTLPLLLPYALRSWAQVTPEQWLVPRLQHLNLFGARHLDSTSVHVMLSSCPGLKHLNLSECCQYLSVSFLHHVLASSISVSVRLSWAKLS